jgi:adenylate kinase family enzyme
MIILIIPIGAPGSGKTTLKNHLREVLPNFYTTERDMEFAKLRKTNSLKKTRKILFDNLEEFLEEIKTTNQKNTTINHYVYLDSSNAKINCRERFYQKLRPKKIIELNFNLPKDILTNRVRTREHPTFPSEPSKQDKMMDIIRDNIEFSNTTDDRITKIYINESKTLKELTNYII